VGVYMEPTGGGGPKRFGNRCAIVTWCDLAVDRDGIRIISYFVEIRQAVIDLRLTDGRQALPS
jgi:hypothetical protein